MTISQAAAMITNTGLVPVRYCFTRENNRAYVTYTIRHGTLPSDTNSDWFDLLPGHQCRRSGPFGGINWEPVQSLTANA